MSASRLSLQTLSWARRLALAAALGGSLLAPAVAAQPAPAVAPEAPAPAAAPSPLLGPGKPVAWWFAYKFNARNLPSVEDPNPACLFGGEQQHKAFSQRYALATSEHPALAEGGDYIGKSLEDPLGATFAAVYTSDLNYVVWNDEFKGQPPTVGTDKWGHSKGLLAWDGNGDGFILQVTTPSWPGSGNAAYARLGLDGLPSGNTLGCIAEPNNLQFAQHFFALRLTHADVVKVLEALANASVITSSPALAGRPEVAGVLPPDVRQARQLIRNGGPADVSARVATLAVKPPNPAVVDVTLSSGVRLISKPSSLHVPPWQLISSILDAPLRTATWWASPQIPSAHAGKPGCWDTRLGTPQEVQVALTGTWEGQPIGLRNSQNHAKLGVSLDPAKPYVVFGDMNQQGTLVPKRRGRAGPMACDNSQNGRGGLFFVLENEALAESFRAFMAGDSAGY